MREIVGVGLAAALLACGSTHPIDRPFDDKRAVKVEVTDDAILVDGNPASLDDLSRAAAEAWNARGVGERAAVLILIRYAAKPGENPLAYEQRKQARTQGVLDALTAAGFKDIHLGPLAKNESEEEREKERK